MEMFIDPQILITRMGIQVYIILRKTIILSSNDVEV